MIRQLVAGELGAARIDFGQVREALQHRHPVAFDASTRRAELASALLAEEETPGVLKARFRIGGTETDLEKALREREALLQEAAHHIARAVRNDRLYDEATRDALTGLFNKRHMTGQLEKMLELARRGNKGLALLIVDLDHFKQVNDRYGHLTGDMILRDVGALVQKLIRGCDLACRYGGEELVVILPKGGAKGAATLADRIRAGVASRDFYANSGEVVALTASIGYAAFDADIETVEDLIARADAALYEAKHAGRNRVIAWTPTMEIPEAVRDTRILPQQARA
jgi:diguanylate cyclase (GGDEF)-like protein